MIAESDFNIDLDIKSKNDYVRAIIELRNKTRYLYVRQFVRLLNPEDLFKDNNNQLLKEAKKRIPKILDHYVHFFPQRNELKYLGIVCKCLYRKFDKVKSKWDLDFYGILLLMMELVVVCNHFEDLKRDLEEVKENPKIKIEINVNKTVELNIPSNNENKVAVQNFLRKYANLFVITVGILSKVVFSPDGQAVQNATLPEIGRTTIVNQINQARQNPEFAQLNRANAPNLKVPLPKAETKQIITQTKVQPQQQVRTKKQNVVQQVQKKIVENVKKTFAKKQVEQRYYFDDLGTKFDKNTGSPLPPPGFEFVKKNNSIITGYTPTGSGLMAGKYTEFEDGKTSIGKNAFIYDGIAVNPTNPVTYTRQDGSKIVAGKTNKFIEYDNIVYIPGVGWKIADDTGGRMKADALKGIMHIDVRVPTNEMARKLTKNNQIIYIFKAKNMLALKNVSKLLTHH